MKRHNDDDDVINDFSDVEDDTLPPPMAPLNGERAPTPAPESLVPPTPLTPNSPRLHKDRGDVRHVPAGAPSVDSAVESWESSSAEATGPRSSTGIFHFDNLLSDRSKIYILFWFFLAI